MTCRYSSLVVATLMNVAVTFQGLVETYKRGDAEKQGQSRPKGNILASYEIENSST